jgi:hypothetical protein
MRHCIEVIGVKGVIVPSAQAGRSSMYC